MIHIEAENYFQINKITLNKKFTSSIRPAWRDLKYLDITKDSFLTLSKYIDVVCTKLAKAIYSIPRIHLERSIVNEDCAREIYFATRSGLNEYWLGVMDLQKRLLGL